MQIDFRRIQQIQDFPCSLSRLNKKKIPELLSSIAHLDWLTKLTEKPALIKNYGQVIKIIVVTLYSTAQRNR